MHTDMQRLNQITRSAIGIAFGVGNGLGSGFMEKCYENAMANDLRRAGHKVVQQAPVKVWYKDEVVGEYVADLLVDDLLIIELKAVEKLVPAHMAQCINYLAATKYRLCLLINFGRRVEVRRIAGSTLNDPSSSVSISAPSVAENEPIAGAE